MASPVSLVFTGLFGFWGYRGSIANRRKTLKRINLLLDAAARDPFAGIGKPEALVGHLSGYWSRRIDESNRLVYRATDDDIVVVGCRYHYDGCAKGRIPAN